MHVLVVGGGSAGWISAALLRAALDKHDGPHVSISLIESPRIGRIGVGEATVPTMKRTLRRIGLSEAEFLRAADATFKHGIQFRDWEAAGRTYFHAFDYSTLPNAILAEASRHWLRSDRSLPYSRAVSAQPCLAERMQAPKTQADKDFGGTVSYAYHLDAEKLADTLMTHATARGVAHHSDEVTGVERRDNGDIAAVHTADGLRLEADLFIDCTGFARRLIGQEMGVGMVDYGQWLLCDRAVAFRVPYDEEMSKELVPYTSATALGHGWAWDIRLQKRRGTGYVYASAFLGAEAAEAELRRVQSVPEDLSARHIRFASGRAEKFWCGNVVAVGLAGGFLEPLESTGLYFVETGIEQLLRRFPEGRGMRRLAEDYNAFMAERYEECLDFINLHYCLTRRRHTEFWREVAKPERITPRLQNLLELWQEKLPFAGQFNTQGQLFGLSNWEAILFGMGWAPEGLSRGDAPLEPGLRNPIVAAEDRARITLPSHAAYIAALGTAS